MVPRPCLTAPTVLALIMVFIVTGCTPAARLAPPPPSPSSQPALRVSGSGTALPAVQKLAEAYRQQHPTVRFQFEAGTNSGGAIRGVLQGTLDLAVANRPLSPAEAAEALVYHPFARDAVVFAGRPTGQVEGLATAQIQDIFGGTLVGWQQVGGAAAPIIVLDRDEDESMRKLVLIPLLAGRPVRAQTVTLNTAREMVEALEGTPNSLGYTSLGLLQILRPRNVSVFALDGVTPSTESLVQGIYPWYLTFGLIHRPDAPPTVQDFVAFVLRLEGRRVLEQYSYAAAER